MAPEIKTLGDLLYWAYANLAMAHAAHTDKSIEYSKKHYFIRSKLFKGLKDNTMDIRSFFDDERLKMILPQACCYCGSTDHLAADHIIPKKHGGLDVGENLVWACRSCNSSKSATDMMEWMQSKNMFPSVLLYRRYLKIITSYCRTNDLLALDINQTCNSKLPFNTSRIPQGFLPLSSLKLWVTEVKESTNRIEEEPLISLGDTPASHGLSTRIATWNLDHASNGSRPIGSQIEEILKITPDILVVTETCKEVDLTRHGYGYKLPTEKNSYGKYCAVIWSKHPITKQHATFEPKTAVCAEIAAPLGNFIVYGTIITYHGDRGPDGQSPIWFEHHKAIQDHGDDWCRLAESTGRSLPFIICGDFNQTRDGSQVYCSKGGESIRLLDEQLRRNNLVCLTEENFGENSKISKDPRKGYPRNNIDHICVTKGWDTVTKVGAWDHFTESAIYMSDHNGVYVDIRSPVVTAE